MKTPAMIMFLFALVGIFHIAFATAKPPGNVTPDPSLQTWFEGLKELGTCQPRCSISDRRFTKYTLRERHYEVIIDYRRYSVPDGAVLHRTDNPTGLAVVCSRYVNFGDSLPPPGMRITPEEEIKIMCFIPPESIS